MGFAPVSESVLAFVGNGEAAFLATGVSENRMSASWDFALGDNASSIVAVERAAEREPERPPERGSEGGERVRSETEIDREDWGRAPRDAEPKTGVAIEICSMGGALPLPLCESPLPLSLSLSLTDFRSLCRVLSFSLSVSLSPWGSFNISCPCSEPCEPREPRESRESRAPEPEPEPPLSLLLSVCALSLSLLSLLSWLAWLV